MHSLRKIKRHARTKEGIFVPFWHHIVASPKASRLAFIVLSIGEISVDKNIGQAGLGVCRHCKS